MSYMQGIWYANPKGVKTHRLTAAALRHIVVLLYTFLI